MTNSSSAIERSSSANAVVGGAVVGGAVTGGAVTGVVGSVQAEEAIKILLGAGEPLRGRIFQHDALRAENRTVEFSRDPECPVCSRHPRIRDLARYAEQVSARGHVLV